MQTNPSALVHASCLSLEPSDVGSQQSRPIRSLTDDGPRALEVTYPNLSFEAAEASASISKWEHATPMIPSTPRRHGPNIGKRRAYTPDLSRSAKSLSHSTKMAKIFQEASAGFQETALTPSRQMSANTSRSRLPLPQHKNRITLNISPIGADPIISPQLLRLRSEARPETTLPTTVTPTPPAIPYDQVFPPPMPYPDTPCGAKYVDRGNWDPPSSGFAEPAAIKYGVSTSGSDLDSRPRDFPSSPPAICADLDDGECHSSHGVPLIIPVPYPEPNKTNKSLVEAWLRDVPGSSSVPDAGTASEPHLPYSGGDDQINLHHTPIIPQSCSPEDAAIAPQDGSCHVPSRASSNKENVHPISLSLADPPSTLIPLPLSSPPAFFSSALRPIQTLSRTKLPFTSSSVSRFQHPRTPSRLFSVAPTRRTKSRNTASGKANGTPTDKNTHVIGKCASPVPFQACKPHSNIADPPPTLTPLPLSSLPAFLSSALCPIQTLSRTKLPFTSSSAPHLQHPRTPSGLFAVTPTRRIKSRNTASGEANCTTADKNTRAIGKCTSPVPLRACNPHGNSAFDIHEDPVEPDDVQLSPDVDCFRKGRGPKRAKARCASYYDIDILGENSSPTSKRAGSARGKRKMGKERRVLGTHDESEEMCTPEAFVKAAEGAEFEYRARGEAREGL